MITFLRLAFFTLITIYFCPSLSALATEASIEERQGQIVEPGSPPRPMDGQDMVILGSTPLPAELLKKLDARQLADILESQAKRPKTTIEHILNEEILVPGIVFSSLTLVSFLVIYFAYRKRRDALETVRIAIQSGQTLPASFLEALEAKSKPTPDSDLRKAVLLIALGLSAMGVLASLGAEDAGRAWSIGLVPTLLGVGYLFLWHQSQKKLKAGSHNEQR